MIDPEIVRKVARLARIEMPPERLDGLVRDLDRILSYVEKLGELDLSGVPPLSHGTGGQEVYREDVARDSLPRSEALANAPDSEDGFYRVPRVIEEA